jgi:hypothetical protein
VPGTGVVLCDFQSNRKGHRAGGLDSADPYYVADRIVKAVEKDEPAEARGKIVKQFLQILVTVDRVENFHQRLKLALFGNDLT